MSVIKAMDIAFGRLRAPDLDAMEEFLTDFGLTRADRTKDRLYMRGTGPAHHIHVTEEGPSHAASAIQSSAVPNAQRTPDSLEALAGC